MTTLKTLSLIGITALGLTLSACQKQEQKQESAATTDEVKNVVIGFQKSALNLLVSRDEKLINQQFPNANIEWKEFPAGPQMLEALAIGAVDLGYVGNTPPIFAQAADKDLTYIGYEVSPAHSLALVVSKDSTIQKLEDLKGKRIALQKGSNAHEFLSKVLQRAGLTWQDIQPIFLPPADARAAFDKKSVDAWAIWDPFLAAAEKHGQARVVTKTGDFDETYSFYIANPKFIAAHPQAPSKFLKALNDSDEWILKNQSVALEIYQKNTGLDADIAQLAFDRRLKPSPILSLTDKQIQAQQNIADSFQTLGLIPKKINIQPIVWVAPASN
ncbi:sulfonate ABC transporter substrate-binding protein [Acinetobacter sp. NCu2D-2]|uniref:aliphatic sulfonate ABC transporter substrate-binding protein n=1 Tax=Acinetobacter sp. NCu2D-2 TaxID=1608473 RepID=UPI0007CDE6D6|nr:aliphatic sulfonate ABC transporter substrate-binding protein [Acinetobacter sp. NCu2D-2]ANF82998.1 sulfonate ABC transporter substrate-binding protein [Acinetobacter sp. NCu2D-2]